MNQRNAECGLDVHALSGDVEVPAVGLAFQMERPRGVGNVTGDALAERHANLLPQLGLDTDGDLDVELAPDLVEQHERAALGSRHADGDLEHALEELARVDGELDGFDHLAERLQELRLAVARPGAVGPEQPGREGRDYL